MSVPVTPVEDLDLTLLIRQAVPAITRRREDYSGIEETEISRSVAPRHGPVYYQDYLTVAAELGAVSEEPVFETMSIPLRNLTEMMLVQDEYEPGFEQPSQPAFWFAWELFTDAIDFQGGLPTPAVLGAMGD